jgi:predicted TIM-barrel enzyme
MSFEKDVFHSLANNAGVYLRGCEDISKLSAEEKFRFERLVAAQMSLFYSAFVQHGQELIDDEVWEAYADALRRYLSAPGFLIVWTSMETGYPKSFRDMVNKG